MTEARLAFHLWSSETASSKEELITVTLCEFLAKYPWILAAWATSELAIQGLTERSGLLVSLILVNIHQL